MLRGRKQLITNEASAKPEGIELLRVTMLDSSERDYQLSTTEIDWFHQLV